MPAPTGSGTVVARGNAQQAVQSSVIVPFTRSSRWHVEQGTNVTGILINTPAPGPYSLTVPAYGYLAGLLITAQGVGGAGAAATYFEDAPWSLFNTITVQDVNGTPIWQLPGYEAFLASKYGGYRLFSPDPAGALDLYSTPADGNFTFTLPIWFQFGRDGLGCLPNMDAAAQYRVNIVLNSATAAATGPFFTAAPGVAYPTLTLTLHALYRSQPPAADAYGNRNQQYPPAVGTVQYWTAQRFGPLTGAQSVQLTRVGNLIRNHLLVFRDNATGLRATAEASDMPPTIEFDWDSGVRYMSTVAAQRLREYLHHGILQPAGCVWYRNTSDPDALVGNEYGDEWMPTSGASRLLLRFSPAGATSVQLTVLTNDIVPATQQIYQSPQ